jgi:beta-lactamase regulating signal transducer with metallopeptidase domain
MSSVLADHWLVRALGWAILHSLWQGVAIAAIVALLLRVLTRSTANVRYLIACAGLAAMTAGWTFTAASYVSPRPSEPGLALGATTEEVAVVVSPPAAAQAGEGPRIVSGTPVRSWRVRLESWSAAIVFAWLLGVLFLSMRVVFGWYQVRRLRASQNQSVTDALLLRALTIAEHLRVTRSFQIAQSAVVQVPTVVGWLRPLILLPLSALSGLPSAQLDAVIAHELAHVRRHDYLVNILQTAVEVLLFYHPACWWITRQIRSEREHCCDDLVVQVCGDPVGYATALTELESLRGATPALGLAATDGPLLRRVRRLLTPSTANESGPSWMAALLPVAILTIALTSVNAAQSTTPSPARVVPPNEGVMQGQVVDAASGRPLRSVRIEMIGPERAITVTTGEDGKYEANGLEPGKYRISASLPGYVTAHFGGRNRNDIGVLADVSGGRFTTGVDLRLQAAGGVTGRIFDERGEGMSGVEVELVAQRSVPGMTGPGAVAFAQTIEGGEYRFSQVLPGEYWVRAYKTGPGGSHDAREPMALALRELRDRTASGLLARSAYSSTFYPGVTHLEEAQPLRVDAGGELVGIDFVLAAMPTRHVSGRVFDENGRPPSQVQIRMHSMGGLNSSPAEYTGMVDGHGRFDIAGVVTGDYMLMVSATQDVWRWASAVRRITVDEEDVTDLEIRARNGAHVQGRVIRDTGVTRTLDPTGVRVQFQRIVTGSGLFLGGGRPTDADGTFSFETPAGPVTIAVPNVPSGWMVRRIIVDDAEVGDHRFEIAEGVGHRVDVVLTDRITQLLGVVRDGKGRTVMGAEVLVFPEEAPRWTPGARSIKRVRADAFGRFQIDALIPGDYLAVAVDEQIGFVLDDSETMQRFSASGTRVRIADGERRAVDLRVTSLPASR